ncbi:helix-turn-helix domain-containing protein [Nakamurella lactea]|jgi:hypothetical protein|uniref:helix-turn-helix domain-containing protein n=1 Tax=Nakamurella lactea TaxID=459515 RepID=UPI0003F557D6|nr:helix-turn-helix domain-containing protein [Nakamurella lactea]
MVTKAPKSATSTASDTSNTVGRRKQAGLRKGARITGPERDSVSAGIRERYLAGASIRTLAGDLGRSYGFVHRILVDAGVPLRGRGGATRGRRAVPG